MPRQPKFNYDHIIANGVRVLDLGVEHEELWVAPIDKGNWRAYWVLHPADGRRKGRSMLARDHEHGSPFTAKSSDGAAALLRDAVESTSVMGHSMFGGSIMPTVVTSGFETVDGPIMTGFGIVMPAPRGVDDHHCTVTSLYAAMRKFSDDEDGLDEAEQLTRLQAIADEFCDGDLFLLRQIWRDSLPD